MNVLALCAGACGIELGLRLTGEDFRTVCYVEREAFAAANLVQKIKEGLLDEAPIWSDLTTFDGKPWCGKVDLVTAGFPCQPVSCAGQQKGKEDARWLWPDIARIICEVRPRFVFLENVPGLFIHGFGDVLRSLASLGYNAEWDVFSAAGVGAPHLRKRVFVLGYSQCSKRSGVNGGNYGEGRWPGFAERSENVAHSSQWQDDQRRTGSVAQEAERGQGCYAPVGNGGEDVAYSLCPRGQQKPTGAPCNEAENEGWPTEHSDQLASGCKDVADASKCGGIRWSHGFSWWTREPLEALQDARRGRGKEVWMRFSESELGRLAHGVADRVERLMLCGKGVVPLVAAKAWIELKGRMNDC